VSNQPIRKMKSGAAPGLEIAIWEQSTTFGLSYSVKVSKNYKDSKGDWKNTDYFNQRDLPGLMYLLQGALLECEKLNSKAPREQAEQRTEAMVQEQRAPAPEIDDEDIPW
jgi:hypothetical protein